MKRLTNVVGVWWSYVLARFFGIVRLSLPYSLSVEPTNRCNLRCLECPSGRNVLRRERGDMKLDEFKRVVDSVRGKVLSLTLYFQGEPFLNADSVKMIEYAKQAGIWVETSTNAHFIDDTAANEIVGSEPDRIIVSLDGADEQSYVKYRIGGDFEKAVEGIKALVRAKQSAVKCRRWAMCRERGIEIVLQFIVFKHNEDQIRDIKRLGKELGVDRVELKSAQICERSNAELLLTSIPRYARYRIENGSLKRKGRFESICSRVFTNSVITWDGRVVPCCYDKDAKYVFGNILTSSYEEIMKGEGRRDFIKKVMNDRKLVGICSDCMY